MSLHWLKSFFSVVVSWTEKPPPSLQQPGHQCAAFAYPCSESAKWLADVKLGIRNTLLCRRLRGVFFYVYESASAFIFVKFKLVIYFFCSCTASLTLYREFQDQWYFSWKLFFEEVFSPFVTSFTTHTQYYGRRVPGFGRRCFHLDISCQCMSHVLTPPRIVSWFKNKMTHVMTSRFKSFKRNPNIWTHISKRQVCSCPLPSHVLSPAGPLTSKDPLSENILQVCLYGGRGDPSQPNTSVTLIGQDVSLVSTVGGLTPTKGDSGLIRKFSVEKRPVSRAHIATTEHFKRQFSAGTSPSIIQNSTIQARTERTCFFVDFCYPPTVATVDGGSHCIKKSFCWSWGCCRKISVPFDVDPVYTGWINQLLRKGHPRDRLYLVLLSVV